MVQYCNLLVWWISHLFVDVQCKFKWESHRVILLTNFKIGLCADIYDWFLSVMVWWQIPLYSTSLSVWMTLSFFQGHSCVRKQTVPCLFSCKFHSQLRWHLECCHDLLVCWSSYKLYFAWSLIKGENLPWWVYHIDFQCWYVWSCLWIKFFQTWYDRYF